MGRGGGGWRWRWRAEAVAVECAAAADEAAVGGGSDEEMFEEKQMKIKPNNSFASRILLSACAIALVLCSRVSRVRGGSDESKSG